MAEFPIFEVILYVKDRRVGELPGLCFAKGCSQLHRAFGETHPLTDVCISSEIEACTVVVGSVVCEEIAWALD